MWASGLWCLLLIIFRIVLDPIMLFVIKSSVLLWMNFFLREFEFIVTNVLGDV